MRASEFARRLARIEAGKGQPFRPHGAKHRRKATEALIRRANAALIVPGGRVIGYRLPDGSVACEKQRFRCRDTAEAELIRIRRDAAHSYIPVRAYLCDWCDGWHLTSRPKS